MRAFRVSGRSLNGAPSGTNSLLDFLFSRYQRIVRDVQRAFLYFGFDYCRSNASTASIIFFW